MSAEAVPVTRTRSRRLRLGRLHVPVAVAATLAAGIAANLLFGAGYLWSRGGQVTRVHVEARGNTFTAVIDGRQTLASEFDQMPPEGGLVFTIAFDDRIPSLPKPSGIDSIRVTDLDTGATLIQEDFNTKDPVKWGYGQNLYVQDGVLSVRTGLNYQTGTGTLVLFNQRWRNVAVDVVYRNIETASVWLRSSDFNSGAQFSFRPYRHLDQSINVFERGQLRQGKAGRPVELSKRETVRQMVAMATRPYPMLLLFALIAFLDATWLQFFRLPSPLRTRLGRLPGRRRSIPSSAPAVAIAAAAFAVTLYLNYSVLSHMPHIPDSVSYLFQAKILASGHFSAPPPPIPEVFDFFNPNFIIVTNGKWASIYPFGHPAMLAIGMLFGAPWLVPPLVGAGSVVLIYAIARRLYGPAEGLFAALLLATSPFFLMNASSFMSHNTAAFYVLLSLFFLLAVDRRPAIAGVFAGLFFGLLFNTRPLTAVALVPPYGALLLARLVPDGARSRSAQRLAGFAAGGLIALGLYWLYNYGTTGHIFSGGYQSSGDLSQHVGFSGSHSVAAGIENERTQLSLLLLVLNGWPLYVGLSFIVLPFLLGTKRLVDWFLLASAVFTIGSWTLYESNGIALGPRYWYEATPFFMLLASRGIGIAAHRLNDWSSSARAWMGKRDRVPTTVGSAVVYLCVFALVASSVYGWLLGRHPSWQTEGTPNTAEDMKGFNFTDDRLIQLIDGAGLHNALVLVEPCAPWYCFGSVFWRNSTTLDGDIVYARKIDKYLPQLFARYPNRRVYVASYAAPDLVPYGVTPNPIAKGPSGADLSAAPLAGDAIVPTPTIPATPTPAATTTATRLDAGVATTEPAATPVRTSSGRPP